MGYLPSLLPSRACPLKSVSPLKSVPPQELRTSSPLVVLFASTIGINGDLGIRTHGTDPPPKKNDLPSLSIHNPHGLSLPLPAALSSPLASTRTTHRPTCGERLRRPMFPSTHPPRLIHSSEPRKMRPGRCVLKMHVPLRLQ